MFRLEDGECKSFRGTESPTTMPLKHVLLFAPSAAPTRIVCSRLIVSLLSPSPWRQWSVPRGNNYQFISFFETKQTRTLKIGGTKFTKMLFQAKVKTSYCRICFTKLGWKLMFAVSVYCRSRLRSAGLSSTREHQVPVEADQLANFLRPEVPIKVSQTVLLL